MSDQVPDLLHDDWPDMPQRQGHDWMDGERERMDRDLDVRDRGLPLALPVMAAVARVTELHTDLKEAA